jgi:hypothetical protein
MGWEGIGTLIGKIADFIPGRKEKMRNDIESCKKRLAEIQGRSPFTTADWREYERVAKRLSELQDRAKNN